MRSQQHEIAEFWMNIAERVSDLRRLLGIISYVRRYISALKARVDLRTSEVQSQEKVRITLNGVELRDAEHFLVRCAQTHSLSFGFERLLQRGSLKNRPLFELFPFIDARGLIRLTGRLHNSDSPYDRKHPPILPSHNHITTPIVRRMHQTLLHASPVTTLQQLRLQYWPLGERREAKHILSNCSICFRTSAKFAEQLMGALPAERVNPKQAFHGGG